MKRISQLDGIRGVAILLVLIHHYFCMQIVPVPGSLLAYCNAALRLTWSGVDLFFVLSGFLISGILLDHRETGNYFRVFYLRRICRIFPLYFLMVALFICFSAMTFSRSPSFEWLFQKPFPLWSYATFTQNFFVGMAHDYGPRWLSVTWSLAVEEQFYLVIPMLVYFLPSRILPAAVIAGIVIAPILRCISPGFYTFVDMPWRMDALLCGVLLAILVRSRPFVEAVRQRSRWIAALFVVFLAGTMVMTVRPALFGNFDLSWLAGLYFVFVLMAFADTVPFLGGVLRLPVFVRLGQISYGVYLFQQPVSGLLHGLIRHGAPLLLGFADAAVTLLALGVTLLLAELSFRFFEGPILRFGHRFQYRPATSLN